MAKEAVPTALEKDDAEYKVGAKRWRFLPVAIILAGLGLGYALGWHQYLSLDYLADSRLALKAFVGAYPVLAPLGFAVLYAIAVAFSFPAASVLTIFSGFLFGWLLGGIIALIAATAGATALFLAARTAFGGFLKQRAGPAAARLANGFENDAFG
ncbi:MAG: TVP38/TMEM64 family protein, partial [Pseudaminobacter sp.]|nr:TVP38/TMEM64 family protein [Pseudaminobacter sp.]